MDSLVAKKFGLRQKEILERLKKEVSRTESVYSNRGILRSSLFMNKIREILFASSKSIVDSLLESYDEINAVTEKDFIIKNKKDIEKEIFKLANEEYTRIKTKIDGYAAKIGLNMLHKEFDLKEALLEYAKIKTVILIETEERKNKGNASGSDLRAELEAQRNLMITVATGGPKIDSVNHEYKERRELIKIALSKLGIDDPNPYIDLWAWYGKWSSGDLPTYQSRRQYITNLYSPLLEKLFKRDAGIKEESAREPTGWARVDRDLGKVRQQLATAKDETDFQAVGFYCREVLVSLAQEVYDSNIHISLDGKAPSKTDAKRMLEAYIGHELKGGGNEEIRRHAKASLDLANALQHKRMANVKDAAMCAEATTSVINLIGIISGTTT